MLESLTIRNYAIIEEMTATFSPGLNVITGETGAGKSIVVDALELLLGARSSQDMIRAGAPGLEVAGVFSGDALLCADGVEDDGDGVLILRREVRADGASRCYINDRPATLRVLKDLGDRLVDFHGQHDHQSLFVVAGHAGYLDGFAGAHKDAHEVARLHDAYASCRSAIEEARAVIETSERDRELYAYQLDEIEKADIQPGEDAELEASIRKLARARELRELGMRVFDDLSETEGSVAERLGVLSAEIGRYVEDDPDLAPWLARMEEIAAGADDIARWFGSYADDIDDDPALLAEQEDRLALIERLVKKHGRGLDGVFAARDHFRAVLDMGERSRDDLDGLEKRLAGIGDDLAHVARRLSESRAKAAPALCDIVEGHLAELGMVGAKFVAGFSPSDHGVMVTDGDGVLTVARTGLEKVEFLIAANPGDPPRPLAKVASGGEISRVMLALKLALVDTRGVPTMVFDEIDVGVSGRIGEAVGVKLHKLTARSQALVITHLPQIAVMADRHFSARKTTSGDRTVTGLAVLDDEMRVRELASLLSGGVLADTAIAHARELLGAAQNGADARKGPS